MKQVEERYISLLTDFGFKRIFGTAMNKDLLICFLNSLFNGRQVVKDVSYLNPEHVGDVYTDRRAIFDVYCEGENGEKFIVEMQNAYQTYFKDRALFYSTFPIREQAPKGNEWDFKLNHIYTVALLNFSMNEDAFDKEKIRHHVQLCDTATHKVFYDKLEYIYVDRYCSSSSSLLHHSSHVSLYIVILSVRTICFLCCFFFNDTATTEIYTLSLHDALPIFRPPLRGSRDSQVYSAGNEGV